jgi:hypothetical protein
MDPTQSDPWVIRGAKYGAIIAVAGGAFAMLVFSALAWLEIPVFGCLCVLEGSVSSNVIGAAISFAVLAVGGMIVGMIFGRVIGLLVRFRARQTSIKNSQN